MPLTGLDLTLERWLLLIVWGGFVGLDGVSWLQVMISRPIVAGKVGGVLLGDAEAGFLAGAVLELRRGLLEGCEFRAQRASFPAHVHRQIDQRGRRRSREDRTARPPSSPPPTPCRSASNPSGGAPSSGIYSGRRDVDRLAVDPA